MFRKLRCNGVQVRTEEEAWLAANPSLGYGTYIAEYAHKHRLKLTGWRWSGLSTSDIHGPDTTLQFTCLEGCENPDATPWKHEIKRRDYDNLVLRNPELKIYGHQEERTYTWPT
jgi:hypothetical protein